MSFTLMDGTVIGEDARGALRAARSADQEVILRVARLPANGGCTNCGGLGVLWFAFLRGPGSKSPGARPGVPQLYDNGLWRDFDGQVFDCPVCNENGRDRLLRLWEGSGLTIPERAWRPDYLNGRLGKAEAVAAAHELLASCPKPVGWVSFFGEYGVGKSGLLKSLVAACVRAGVSARYVRGADILSETRSTYDDKSAESERALVLRYGRYQFLAVDEVDRVSGTEWARSTLFTLLDDRYTRRDAVATAIATNAEPGGMGELWGYLESRMKDGARVIVGGDDLRGVA